MVTFVSRFSNCSERNIRNSSVGLIHGGGSDMAVVFVIAVCNQVESSVRYGRVLGGVL